jgi:hypothetical protein
MLTIKIGVRELGLIVVFLLGLALAAGRVLQRVDTLEHRETYIHGSFALPQEAR